MFLSARGLHLHNIRMKNLHVLWLIIKFIIHVKNVDLLYLILILVRTWCQERTLCLIIFLLHYIMLGVLPNYYCYSHSTSIAPNTMDTMSQPRIEFHVVKWCAVALWLKHWTLSQEDLDLNPLAISKPGQFCSFHIASVHSAV